MTEPETVITALLFVLDRTRRPALADGEPTRSSQVNSANLTSKVGLVLLSMDSTWKVGGENAHLMAFDTKQATVYQVRYRHRHQEVPEVVPWHYPGVMVTDRGRSYDAHSFSRVKQQKCLAHLQKTLSTLVEKKKGRAREFGENLKMLFRVSMDLWEEYHAGAATDFEARAAELQLVLSYLLRTRALKDPDNHHVLKALGRYHRRGELLSFLEYPSIEPTNNRVERALRPAVIARKVAQCSKNAAGAYAFAAFKSVVQTVAKRGTESVVEALFTLFRSPKGQPDNGQYRPTGR